MSSCFLCDCSYNFRNDLPYNVYYAQGQSERHYIKYMPIMVGSSGTDVDDQQHENNKKQNYVSYRVKRIEFRAAADNYGIAEGDALIPDYIIIFKVPFREVIFDYHFGSIKNFMLYSEPESVLKYGVYSCRSNLINGATIRQKSPDKYDLIVNKPFVVGPNDYVGVLYFFSMGVRVSSSARVWFDIF